MPWTSPVSLTHRFLPSSWIVSDCPYHWLGAPQPPGICYWSAQGCYVPAAYSVAHKLSRLCRPWGRHLPRSWCGIAASVFDDLPCSGQPVVEDQLLPEISSWVGAHDPFMEEERPHPQSPHGDWAEFQSICEGLVSHEMLFPRLEFEKMPHHCFGRILLHQYTQTVDSHLWGPWQPQGKCFYNWLPRRSDQHMLAINCPQTVKELSVGPDIGSLDFPTQ